MKWSREKKNIFFLNEGKRIFKDHENYSDSDVISYARLATSIFKDTPIASEDIILKNLIYSMNFLSEKEKNVICLCFGLNGHPITPLRDIGTQMYYSHEGVRQIQTKALRKLRSHTIRATYVISWKNNLQELKAKLHPTSTIFIEDLDFDTQITNALRRAGIRSAYELLTASDRKLMSVRGIGTASLNKIHAKKRQLYEKYPTFKTV